ncbi:hypothetical protein ACEQ8H_007208 [Pleosporales sp. CAS-2024a]
MVTRTGTTNNNPNLSGFTAKEAIKLHNSRPVRYTVSDLERHGYIMCRYGCDETIDSHTKLLNFLGTDELVLSNDPAIAARVGGDNIDMMHSRNLNRDTVMDGVPMPMAFGFFCSVINLKIGLLMATNNMVPPEARHASDAAPPLRHWSDVAFLQWCLAPSLPGAYRYPRSCPPPLNYILRCSIQNQETLQVVAQVMGLPDASEKSCHEQGFVPRPAWPGTAFEMDTEEAVALLGTPNGKGVGWLLAQHKEELGHRVVHRVSVFWALDSEDMEQVNLLFWVKGADEVW